MKTPIQELIESITLQDSTDHIVLIPTISKAEIQSLLDKEKETIVDFTYKCRNVMAADEFAITHWYDKTFNAKYK